MKPFYLFITILILFIFQGCTTKHATTGLNHQEVKSEAITSNTLKNGTLDDRRTQNNIEEFEEEFSEQESDNTIDPLSGYNRVMTSFNDNLMMYVFIPVSEAYATILPQSLRLGVSNAVDNIQFPIRFANNLLQGKLQNASNELERFVINSTVGIAGLIDVASDHMTTPIPAHDEDFGQTLGHYGIGSGFHIVLPLFGPSNVRDVVGLTVDAYTSPLVYIKNLKKYKIPNNRDHSIAILMGSFINKTSLHLGEYENLREDAIDLYPFFRDTYEQKRDSDIAE
jgi:phospholipid-binding lipoprotein MlaA